MDLCLGTSARLLIALCLCFAGRLGAQRIDVDNVDRLEPIVRVSPASDDTEDMFGFATVLHQIQVVNPSDDVNAAAQKARIIIGAPSGTFPGGLPLDDPGLMAENRTGLVYSCPVQPGECEGIQGDLSLYINMPDNDMSSIDLTAPLDIEGRLFDQAPNAMVLNQFTTTRGQFEIKEGQLMGATLFSNGDSFIACAPRWTQTRFTIDAQPRGACYASGRGLTNFEFLQPCAFGTASSNNAGGEGYCMAGVSATRVGNLYAIAGPGYDNLRGSVYYGEANADIRLGRGQSQEPDAQGNLVDITDQYQGFQTTTGFISQPRSPTQTPDHIATVPRYNGFTYTGRVNINDTTRPYMMGQEPTFLDITAQGQQMGEFFGYSVVAADLNGDDYDELLVGAPMYTDIPLAAIERGRVYVFNNTGGNLNPSSVILEGRVSRGRFGTSVTNLGDIDDDGYEDIAIGAPYADVGSSSNQGAVYIYYGRADIMEFGRQTPVEITAEQIVDNVQGLDELRTFGWSLSSGVDVDNNEYRDLSIGAYESKTVVLLRTIPVASVNVTFDAVPAVNLGVPSCNMRPCFDMTIRATYTGRGLTGALNIDYTLSENLTTSTGTIVSSRLVFDTQNNTEITRTLSFTDAGVEFADTVTVYARTNVADTVSPYRLQIEIQNITRPTRPDVNGNQTLTDLSDFPVLRRIGETSTSVSIVNPCGEVCDSDVALTLIAVRYLNSSEQAQDRFVAGAVTSVEFDLEYSNVLGPEDAIGATLSHNLPTIFTSSFRVGEGNRDCTPISSRMISCNLPNPLTPQLGVMRETFRLVVSDQIIGNEPDVDIIFSLGVSQGSRETNTANNDVTRRLSVSAEADIVVTLVALDNVQYSANVPEDVTRADQLGQLVQELVAVTNRGPTTIQNARLVTYFPAQSAVTGINYFLYPSQAPRMAGGNSDVDCDVGDLNPEMLVLLTNNRRRRRSATSSPLDRTPRQDTPSGLDCSQEPETCLAIRCDITRLEPGVSAEVNIISYVDDRFYAGLLTTATYTLVIYSRVNITDEFLLPEANTDDNTARSVLLVGPPDAPAPVDDGLLIHAIIWPTLAVLIIIVVLGIILYAVGFLRRKKRPVEGEAEGDFDVNKFQVQQVPEQKAVEATQL